jgi:20S proteasome subunit alpha 6
MIGQNQYDQDVLTWSPTGRLFQVEYAMQAVEQGTPVLGLRSKTAVVLCSNMRAQSELAEEKKKVMKIDNHLCIGIAGLTSDARVLAEFMRGECLNHQFVYDTPMNVGRLVTQIGDKSQTKTQNSSGKRPYGVGLLVAGYDEQGPHLFQTCPSGNYFEFYAMAIGGRSTSAKTYLEKHFDKFPEMQLEELIQYGMDAMNKTTVSKGENLTAKNSHVAIVDKDGYRELPTAELQKYLDKLEKKADDPDATMEDTSAAAPAGDGGSAPMDTA